MLESPHPRVLVIEDDVDIASLLQLHLRDLPANVDVCDNGADGLAHALTHSYDAIVLDVALPGLDGLTLCHALRKEQVFVPILLATARTSEADRVIGLETGADDYLAKPFGIREMQARVRALIRRNQRYRPAPAPVGELLADGLRISPDRRAVYLDGKPIELTAKEFELLLWFARHPGRVFTREQLLDAVWGYAHAGYGHTVNSHINRLRCKLERDPALPQFILTVWSVGYKFRDADA